MGRPEDRISRDGYVAIIEREHVGGSCVNVGCTPTKTMVASARVAYLARRAAEFGVRTGPVSVDQTVVRKRKRDDRGFIPVDERLETNVSGIYAMGDVNGGPAFTHVSYDDYRLLAANLLDGGDLTTDGRLVPYTLYIDPQLGRIGLTEREARDRGLDFQVAKMPMTHVARALESDESRGFMKAIVDSASGRILGCAVLGMEGGELMSMIQIAMMGDLPYAALRDAIFAHPALAESLNNLFSNL
jgi:pyruvate/2-oxoglutarate dehydrogenase complex dihydrolipoamide dehydrogenase (E3) component